MPPFDREGVLKNAEKALRQGRIDAAIAEYVRVVEAQPRDWNSANALGDLYVRANQIDKGIGQFERIADHLASEGFYSKASALYKKILKIKPDAEHALLQSADLAARQGLLADAKNAYKTVADRRRKRGDLKGAAEINVRIGTLDPEDLDARLGAARAAADIGDTATALRELTAVAAKYDERGLSDEALGAWQLAHDLDPRNAEIRARLFERYLATGDLTAAQSTATNVAELKQVAGALEAAGRVDEALQTLAEVARQDPADREVSAGLAKAYLAKGNLEKARAFLSEETAGDNPSLWLTLANVNLTAGRLDEGRAAIARALTLDGGIGDEVVALGCRLATEGKADAGYVCINAAVDAALQQRDFVTAAVALQEFVRAARHHVVGLMRLVEICVDGELESTLYEAQAQLADAYLEVGRGLEARIISEDLVAREPQNQTHVDRFRRALVMLGETDPEAVIAEHLSGDSPFLPADDLDLNEGVTFDEAGTTPDEADAGEVEYDELTADAAAARGGDAVEYDEVTAVEGAGEDGDAGEVIDLNAVFQETAAPADSNSVAEQAAAEEYQLAITYRDLGMVEQAVAALEIAARSPRQRFDACAMLGRVYLEEKQTGQAVEWLERAAAAPAPSADAGRALLYDLGETLETLGEHARALAVFVELESESGGYRDVAGRIERLSKAQAKG